MESKSKPNVYASKCPTREVLDLIANKWTVLIINCLYDDKRRFSQLQKKIEGISQKMLTQTLRNLESNGLVSRTVIPSVPIRVEYELTALGKTLCEPLRKITGWAEHNIDRIKQARSVFAHKAKQD